MINGENSNEQVVIVPLTQEEGNKLELHEVLAKLGEVGLSGRPVVLSQIDIRESLLAYDFEKQPSLGVVSYSEFNEFAMENGAAKGKPMTIWASLATFSEIVASAQLAKKNEPDLIEQYQEAKNNVDILTAESAYSPDEEKILWEALPKARHELDEILKKFDAIDAKNKGMPIEFGNGDALIRHIFDPEFDREPFIFHDAECTKPIYNNKELYSEAGRQRIHKNSFMKVDDMYDVFSKSKPGHWPIIRGPKFDQMMIQFLNSRIIAANATQ